MKTLFIIFLVHWVSFAYADGQTNVTRIGGSYQVSKIEKLDSGEFKISFESENKTGRFDYLELVTDHVNLAVEKGKSINLSAEVASVKGNRTRVKQMVIFLPSLQGQIPIWLLSKKEGLPNIERESFLKMHAPTSDYTVF